MTERQIKQLAREIKLMAGSVPGYYRLLFATAVRDVVQATRDFPGWTHFIQECGLTGEEKSPSVDKPQNVV